MKLKELYKHRTDFTIIGLTGRTGSGCSQISDLLSKDLKKRGFKFVGSTVVYAHMQATGMVNDHVEDCWTRE